MKLAHAIYAGLLAAAIVLGWFGMKAKAELTGRDAEVAAFRWLHDLLPARSDRAQSERNGCSGKRRLRASTQSFGGRTRAGPADRSRGARAENPRQPRPGGAALSHDGDGAPHLRSIAIRAGCSRGRTGPAGLSGAAPPGCTSPTCRFEQRNCRARSSIPGRCRVRTPNSPKARRRSSKLTAKVVSRSWRG